MAEAASRLDRVLPSCRRAHGSAVTSELPLRCFLCRESTTTTGAAAGAHRRLLPPSPPLPPNPGRSQPAVVHAVDGATRDTEAIIAADSA